MKKLLPERFFPVGSDRRGLTNRFFTLLGGAALLSAVIFIARFCSFRSKLFFVLPDGTRQLTDGAVMEPFVSVLSYTSVGFLALMLGLVLFAVGCYRRYYTGGSRSIYLMKRLPDPWERHRRCLALPIMGLIAAVIAMTVLFWIYYAIYVLATPSACLAAGQLEGIWR